jgi:cation:H+ antiporter
VSIIVAIAEFLGGAVLVIAATEALVKGLVGVSRALRIAPFVASALLSGLEAENIAVGLAAGHTGLAEVALGTAYGGAIFMLTVALGLGVLVAPLKVQLPAPVPWLLPAAAVLAGLPLAGTTTPRWAGVLLLAAFALAVTYLVFASKDRELMAVKEEPRGWQQTWWGAAGLTIGGLAVITVGGVLVERGASGLISTVGLSAALVGMVISPAVIESEEVIRQAVPAKMGHAEIAAGNLIGTVLYFTLFNLSLITLLTPVAVPPSVRTLDWPVLAGVSLLVAALLARGRLTRAHGLLLLAIWGGYLAVHVFAG